MFVDWLCNAPLIGLDGIGAGVSCASEGSAGAAQNGTRRTGTAVTTKLDVIAAPWQALSCNSWQCSCGRHQPDCLCQHVATHRTLVTHCTAQLSSSSPSPSPSSLTAVPSPIAELIDHPSRHCIIDKLLYYIPSQYNGTALYSALAFFANRDLVMQSDAGKHHETHDGQSHCSAKRIC